jgi:hypothetical protein
MPYFRNENPHGVRVGNSRIPANSVGYVSDEDAKSYANYNGVSKVSDSEGKKAVEEQRDSKMTDVSPGTELNSRMAEARVASRSYGVTGPLQVVIGDDDAPYGPPSGVVTTKQLEAQKGPEEKRRFADHEHIEVPEGASQVEKDQAENTRVVEEVARELAERQSSGESQQPDQSDDEG